MSQISMSISLQPLTAFAPGAPLTLKLVALAAPVGGGASISADPGNRAVAGADGGVYVRDDLVPDPLAYYILAKA